MIYSWSVSLSARAEHEWTSEWGWA